MTIPPIAVESAKEAAHRLLELCMADAPPLDKNLVRTHALDVIEALTEDDEHPLCPDGGAPDPETGAYCPDCLEREESRPVFTGLHPVVRDLIVGQPPNPLQVLHDRAGCCADEPVLLVCRECREGKHGACDSTAWDELLDAPGPCSCTHPGWTPPEWTPEAIDRLKAALAGEE